MSKGLIGRLLSLEAEELPSEARETDSQLRHPRDFGSEAYSDARNRILDAMADHIAVKSENNLLETSGIPCFHQVTTLMKLRWLFPRMHGYPLSLAGHLSLWLT